MTSTTPRSSNDSTAAKVAANRAATGRPIVSPFDKDAPVGTTRRRIKAHNALLDVAVIGVDRICGIEEESQADGSTTSGPCVLREGHRSPWYDNQYPYHMDAEQRDRAERYLVHSEPDPDKRA